MRNHFLRAKGVAAVAIEVTVNNNISTNEWLSTYNSSIYTTQEPYSRAANFALDQNGSGALFLIIADNGTNQSFSVKRLHTDRTTTTGNWSKTYTQTSDPDDYNIFKAEVDSSGNLIVAGSVSKANSPADTRPFVAKINGSTGAVTWCKAFGTQNHHNVTNGSSITAFCIDESDNIYMAGRVRGVDADSNPIHPYVIRIDSDGDLGWVKGIYGYSGWGNGMVQGLVHITPTSNATSDYIRLLFRAGNGASNENIIMEVNKSNGTVNSTKYITRDTTHWGPTSEYPAAYLPESFHLSHNGDYYLTVLRNSGIEIAVLKINSDFSSITWAKEFTLGGSKDLRLDNCRTVGVAVTKSDDVIITCATTANESPSNRCNAYIASLDSSGDTNWQRVIEHDYTTNSVNLRFLPYAVEADTKDNFYWCGLAPFPSTSGSVTQVGVGIIKHQADTAIPAGNYITDNPHGHSDTINGCYEIEDTSHMTISAGSWSITSSSQKGFAPNMPTFTGSNDSNATWNLNTITLNVADLSASDDIYYSANL